jgi:hypothetical protein
VDCKCGGSSCNNLMWIEKYNDVQWWMVKQGLWEKYMGEGMNMEAREALARQLHARSVKTKENKYE